jgi:hypothetical protein
LRRCTKPPSPLSHNTTQHTTTQSKGANGRSDKVAASAAAAPSVPPPLGDEFAVVRFFSQMH